MKFLQQAVCVGYSVYIYNTASYRGLNGKHFWLTLWISLVFAKNREEAAYFVSREKKPRRREF